MHEDHRMRLAYDKHADVLHLSVGDPIPAISREVGDDVLLRLDPTSGKIVGVTILNLSTRNSLDQLPIEIDLCEAAT